jgi:hypothetical protein
MATWSKEFLLEFLEECHGSPCIWKVKSKEYHNREMKECLFSTDGRSENKTCFNNIIALHSAT